MGNYEVRWEIEVEADSDLEAAELARDIQLDPDSFATVFEVRETCKTTSVSVYLRKEF